MGSVATKAAEGYVFPGVNIAIDGKNDDQIKLLKTDSEHYSIPYVHVKTAVLPRAIVFYSHGNAEDLHTVLDYLQDISKELCVEVISYDYAGYGLHKTLDDVKPSEENVYADANTVFAYVKKQGLPIIVWGRSLGSAPAIYVATKFQDEVSGLVVESGFRSIARVVSNTLHNIFDLFDNESFIIQQHNVPTLFVHGRQDHVVPFTHGERLYDLCACPKKNHFWLNDGHHNDIESRFRDEVYIRLCGFFDQII